MKSVRGLLSRQPSHVVGIIVVVAIHQVLMLHRPCLVSAQQDDETIYEVRSSKFAVLSPLSARNIPLTQDYQAGLTDPQSAPSRRSSSRMAPLRRQSSDGDNEESMDDEEDDDRDEYRSASSPNGAYETPAYEESSAAARDGADIEEFFDRHLGPESNQGGSARRRRSVSQQDEDPLEAVASSPLSSILQTLLSVRRRPVIITTSGGDEDEPRPASSATMSAPSNTKQITSSPSVEVSAQNKYLETLSALTQSYLASPSSLTSYDASSGPVAAESAENKFSPFRQVYLTDAGHLNRPTQTQYAPLQTPTNWRQSANPMVFSRPQVDEEAGQAGSVYARDPVAASHLSSRQHPVRRPVQEDGQTVIFGFSLGRQPLIETVDEDPLEDGALRRPMEESRGPISSGDQFAPSRDYAAHAAYRFNPSSAGHSRAVVQEVAYQPAQAFRREPIDSSAAQHADGAPNAYYRAPFSRQTPSRQELLSDLSSEITRSPYYSRPSGSANDHKHRRQKQSESSDGDSLDSDMDAYGSSQSDETSLPMSTGFSHMSLMLTDSNSRLQHQGDKQRDRFDGRSEGQPEAMVLRFNCTQSKADPRGETVAAQLHKRQGAGVQHDPRTVDKQNLASFPEASRRRDAQNRPPKQPRNVTNSSFETKGSPGLLSLESSDLLMHKAPAKPPARHIVRVRRDDTDEREDPDDDGVWVDDDEDDDSRQQSSDVNETSQEPDDDDQTSQPIYHQSDSIGRPHSYDLSPDDLMVHRRR